MKAIGPVADQQCLLLIQDFTDPSKFFYVCSENIETFLPFKLFFEEELDKVEADESVSKVSWLLPDKKDLELIYLHIS